MGGWGAEYTHWLDHLRFFLSGQINTTKLIYSKIENASDKLGLTVLQSSIQLLPVQQCCPLYIPTRQNLIIIIIIMSTISLSIVVLLSLIGNYLVIAQGKHLSII